jgi:hypothetical protein
VTVVMTGVLVLLGGLVDDCRFGCAELAAMRSLIVVRTRGPQETVTDADGTQRPSARVQRGQSFRRQRCQHRQAAADKPHRKRTVQ